jgi:hypothetical protein
MSNETERAKGAEFRERLKSIFAELAKEDSIDQGCRAECEDEAWGCEASCGENDLRCSTRCAAAARACLRKCRRRHKAAEAAAPAESNALQKLDALIEEMERAVK